MLIHFAGGQLDRPAGGLGRRLGGRLRGRPRGGLSFRTSGLDNVRVTPLQHDRGSLVVGHLDDHVRLDAPLRRPLDLVDIPPAGQIVVGRGQFESRLAVLNWNDGLHGSLAIGATAHQQRTFMIPQCAADDFGRARRVLVHQDYDREVRLRALPMRGHLGIVRPVASAGRDDHALREEQIAHLHRPGQEASGVETKVQDQPPQPLFFHELVDRRAKVRIRCLYETAHSHIRNPGGLVDHIVPQPLVIADPALDALDLDPGADEWDVVLFAGEAANGDRDLRARLAGQLPDGVLDRVIFVDPNGLAVDLDDLVTR